MDMNKGFYLNNYICTSIKLIFYNNNNNNSNKLLREEVMGKGAVLDKFLPNTALTQMVNHLRI